MGVRADLNESRVAFGVPCKEVDLESAGRALMGYRLMPSFEFDWHRGFLISDPHTVTPPHDDPAPAVQPKQCFPVTTRRRASAAGSNS